ncbi:MAG: CCA tRNA nucleotidyltransferase [Clostridia bacterium]|nr:CCA tRNA nucleotidyltransferase [Clostridia bacterium]
MKILSENKSLLNFANLIEHEGIRLYIVGGFVRDRLIGVKEEDLLDIDLASSARTSELLEFSKDCGAIVTPISNQMGVAKIYLNNRAYEHATFRKESYNQSGNHYPAYVEFILNAKEDSLRRDFTINALYYDINHERILDFHNGIEDLNNKIVKTIGNARERIKEDSERILRAIRLAVTLNFSLDEELKSAISENAQLLLNLKQQRKNKEIYKIVFNGKENIRLFSFLNDANVLKYVFPGIYPFLNSNIKFYKILDNILKIDNDYKIAFLVNFCKQNNIEDAGVSGLLNFILENYKESENCKNLQKTLKNIAFFTKKRLKPIEIINYLVDNKITKEEALKTCKQIEIFYNVKNASIIKTIEKIKN